MKCPNCGKEIADDSKFCPSCGKQLKTIKYVCPKCGGSVSYGDKYCANCGQIFSWGNTSVQQVEPQKPQKEEKKTRKVNIPSLMIAGGLTFFCFILLIVGFFGSAVVVNNGGYISSFTFIQLLINDGLAKCYTTKTSSTSSFSFAAFDIYIFCLIVMIISFIFMIVQVILTIIAMAKRRRLHTKLFAPIFLANAFYMAMLRYSSIQQSGSIHASFGFGPILIFVASLFLLINIAVYRAIESRNKVSLISIILQYSGLLLGVLAIYMFFGPFISISYGGYYSTASGLSLLVTMYSNHNASSSIASLAWLVFAFGIVTIVFFVDAIMLAVMEKPLASAINSIIGFVFFIMVVTYLTIGYATYYNGSGVYSPTAQTILFYILSMLFANLSIGGFVTQIIGRHIEARA